MVVGARRDARELPSNSALGRYLVIKELGRGGMGVVVHAYDPKLQREVALKMLRHEVMSDEARLRLLREARAMAKLNHPNVVAVYDVSLEDEVLALSMEYVPGTTLLRWLRDAPRTLAEILDVFVQTGEGLAAAHAESLLHRDFKPANVLVYTSDDGQVHTKVTDFGIARMHAVTDGPRATDEAPAEPFSRDDGSTDALSEAGVVMGTPRYMAPEQHLGGPLGPAVDQYAFCVALWEALVGEVPFRGATMVADKRAGPPMWPRQASASSRVVAAIRRGLAPSPEDRFPDMRALLRELSGPRKRSRPWASVLMVGGALALGSAAWTAWSDYRAERCTGAASQLSDAWNPRRRTEVETALLATGAGYALPLWERLGPRLDAYAEDWIGMHTEACSATSVRGEQSTAVLDLRMRCLFRAKRELGAAVELLAHADTEVVRKAHVLVDELPELSRCADVDALASGMPAPASEDVEKVASIEAAVSEARALRRAGKLHAAEAALSRAAAAIERVSYAPVASALEHERGELLGTRGKHAEAEAAYRRELDIAGRANDWGALGQATGQLAALLAMQGPTRSAEALIYLDFAEIVADRDADPVLLSALHNVRGLLHNGRGEFAEAEAEFRAGVELRERAFGGENPALGLRNNLAIELHQLGRYDEAEAEHRALLHIFETNLGSGHPETATAHNNLGAVLVAAARHEEAIEHFRQAVRVHVQTSGEDHPEVAKSRSNVGRALVALGRYAEAEALLSDVIRTWSARVGADHPDIALARSSLVAAYLGSSRFEEAEAEARAVLNLQKQHLPAGHPEIAAAHDALGVVLHATKRHADAEIEMRQAIDLWTAALGADHDSTAHGHSNLGEVLAAQGRWIEAEAELKLALASSRARSNPDHPEVATARRRLAVVLAGLERWEDAEREFLAALSTLERGSASQSRLAEARLRYGRFLRERGRLDEAREQLDRAWAALRDDETAVGRGEAAFELARVLWLQGERTRARELAREADRAFARAGAAWQEDRDAVAAWLRTLG